MWPFNKKGVKISTDFSNNVVFGKNWHYLTGWEKCTCYFIKMQNATLEGKDFFLMSENDYKEAVFYAQQQKEKEELFLNAVDLNNKGSELEKAGKIEDAVAIYEENIKSDCLLRHSYDRLLVYYRKVKDAKNELRVLNKAIKLFPDETKYVERKEKIKNIKDNEQSPR